MKKKRRLGEMIRASREAIGLSQRELGRSVGVTASHIACIESGKRRPSHFLLFRLARRLGINRQELFLVAWPELSPLILPTLPTDNREAAWRSFVAVAGRYSVTPKEMAVLREISRLGKISSLNSYFWILNSIRQSFVAD
jgi:transcriptional regulator with XRE-family HTH domain